MLLDMVLLIKNLQKKYDKFLKLNHNALSNQNIYKNLMIKLPNLLLILFTLH